MQKDDIIIKFQELGLSHLEATVYMCLYRQPHTTGYKIAQTISKPVANTYKALQKLEKKGLIACSEYENTKLYDPIDLEEYLQRLESDLHQKKENLLNELKKIKKPEKSFSSFILNDLDQVYEKAKFMIAKSEETLLLDVFPTPFKAVNDKYQKCKAKEKKIKIYHNPEENLENAIISFNKDFQMETWKAQWLIVSKDAEESLVAAVSHDGNQLFHAIWSTDPFLSFILYNGLANEFMLIEILNRSNEMKLETKNEIENIHKKYTKLFDFELKAGNKILQILEEK